MTANQAKWSCITATMALQSSSIDKTVTSRLLGAGTIRKSGQSLALFESETLWEPEIKV
jgi:hypothetical protein